jgi:hypothetical protein
MQRAKTRQAINLKAWPNQPLPVTRGAIGMDLRMQIPGVKSWSVKLCDGSKKLFVTRAAALRADARPCGPECKGTKFHYLDRLDEKDWQPEEIRTSRGEKLSDLRARAHKEGGWEDWMPKDESY